MRLRTWWRWYRLRSYKRWHKKALRSLTIPRKPDQITERFPDWKKIIGGM